MFIEYTNSLHPGKYKLAKKISQENISQLKKISKENQEIVAATSIIPNINKKKTKERKSEK